MLQKVFLRKALMLVLVLYSVPFTVILSQTITSSNSCVIVNTATTYNLVQTPPAYTGTSTWDITVGTGTIIQVYVQAGGSYNNSGSSVSGTNIYQIAVKWTAVGSGTGTVRFTRTDATGGTSSASIQIANPLSGGTISSGGSQNIPFYTLPADIICSAASGGNCSPAYSYQWQVQTPSSGGSWANMAGKTSKDLSFSSALTETGYYSFQRMVTETGSNTPGYSNSTTVYVGTPFTTTTVSPTSQTIFTDGTLSAITSSAPTGGSCGGAYGYNWHISTDGINFTPTGQGTLSYQPAIITGTRYYKLLITCGGQNAFSAVSTVNVYAHTSAGTISTPSQKITFGTDPGNIMISAASGGMCSGNYSYQWQYSVDGNTNHFYDITSSTPYNQNFVTSSLNYDPGPLTATTWFRRKVTCGSETVFSNAVQFTITPQLFPGTVTPSVISITSGTSPGQILPTPASGGECNGNYTYKWQSRTEGGSYGTGYIPGAISASYTPNNLTVTTYFRREVTCTSDVIDIENTNEVKVVVGAVLSYNYIQSREITKPGVTDITTADALTALTDVKQTTQYFDGLGRPLQTVTKQASPLGFDAVVASMYDEFGREVVKYLPYVSTASDGKFRPNAVAELKTFNAAQFSDEQYYFSRTDYESSPLNLVLGSYAPGNNWVGANRGVTKDYYSNRPADDIKIWNVTNSGTLGTFGTYAIGTPGYAEGTLYKIITNDENNKQVIEFKDKDGRVILKKVQLTATADDGSGSGYTGWLCTYYIYDDLNNLRCVIQPRGVELLIQNGWNMSALSGSILNEQCFRYEYDGRNRTIMKKVPGAGEVYMVYDKRDRLVFTQDAKLRPQNQWMYTLYDDINRPVQTGIMVYASGWSSLVTVVNAASSSTASTSISGNNVDAIPAILNLTTREPGINPYNATQEINFNGEFQSEAGAEFDAVIVTGSGTSFTGTQSVNTNALTAAGVTGTALTYTFYDDYSFTSKAYNAGENSKLDAGTNPYAETLTTATMTRVTGLATGSRVRVLDPVGLSVGEWMETVSFYDEKLRVAQVQSVNVTGGTDITTTQYDFAGKPLSNNITHQKLNGAAATYMVTTRNTYDGGSRLTKTEKKINTGSWKTITVLAYNELNQLKTKKLGTDPVTPANPLETLTYDYNIRGWMLGANRDYAKTPNSTTNYFGFDLGYDKTDIKPGSGSSIGSFTVAAYNGNITGMVWKSTGDDKVRKYDFTYDAVNRLTGANFKQYSGSNAFDLSENIDFTVSNLTYDANGNIKTQQQKGWKPGGSATIDNLTYNYINNNSNKLQNVVDASNDPTTTLGDFRASTAYMSSLGGTKTNAATDYTYDVNGNLSTDNNKDITSVVYNHLNLPQTITVTGKGTIQYIYDAAGNKLKKIVQETGKPDKTTLYLFGNYQDDALQFLPQEEGRIRKKDDGSFVYDYFLKDHLGNTRMVLTEEQQTDAYPVASLETATLNSEKAYYSLPDAARVDKSTVPQYPTNDTYTNPNDFIQKLKGDATKVGSSIVLRVMAGDKVNIHASSWWTNNNVAANPANTVSPLTDIVTSLINTVPAASGGKVVTGQLTSTILNPSVTDLLNNRNSNNYATAKPKAYLNWILLDDQFNEVLTNDGKNSGFEQVGADAVFTQHNKTAVEMTKNGYLYVYVSNESTDINVFFDNLQVTQVRGRILEETHYYPFGLTMAGISSKAVGKLENKFKYNGIEKIGDFDLQDYDAQLRELDPQIGRWWEVDPKIDNMEAWSPYASNYDNPITYKDPLGDAPGDPDDEAPHTEHFHAATKNEYKESPWRALAIDAGWFLANLTGATAVDDAVTTFKDENASTSDKVLAVLNVGFATVRGGEGHLSENFGEGGNIIGGGEKLSFGKKGGTEPNQIGSWAEKATGMDKPGEKQSFEGASGTMREADKMTKTTVHETKNVKYQHLSTQIKDYIKFASDKGQKFILWLRGNTKVSKQLQEEINKGTVKRKKIPGT